ncbi:MAG: M6 family metalloprotease domain-containing protein [Bacteroidaceae bacterium]|nr:M6 family metalloprotease domain-containing protein [Bacteroidaceae bacterium]
MKILLAFFMFVFSTVACLAVPARPYPVTVQQPDGTSLTFYLRGDEYYRVKVTVDGMPIMQGKDDAYYYAFIDSDTLACSSMLAHNAEHRSAEETGFVKAQMETVTMHLNNARERNLGRRVVAASSLTRSVSPDHSYRGMPVKGKRKVIIILAEYADTPMIVPDVRQAFDDRYNAEGYNKDGHLGSVREYFRDQSYGLFDPEFDIVGPVRLSKTMAYYGKNRSGGSDAHPGEMVAEACRLAENLADFSQYDWDGDGYVDQVYVIYAGYNEAEHGGDNTIWPHSFDLYSSKQYYSDGPGIITIDGVKINQYACSSELSGSEGGMMASIGTFCHEFSHCLGLMDVYDINYNGGFGMNCWDVMDAGNYNGPTRHGEVPCGYTAFERWYLGWLEYKVLDSPATVTRMPSLGDQPVAYAIYNDNHTQEYFTLENRQNNGWYSYVGEYTSPHGMIISHIDFNQTAWDKNSMNAVKRRQRIGLVPADNNFGVLEGSAGDMYYWVTEDNFRGDPFPGLTGATEFTDDSHKSSGGKLYNLNADFSSRLGKPVTNITESVGFISFDFMGGNPDGMSAPSVSATNANIIYNVSGKEVPNMDRHGFYIIKNGSSVRKVVR